MCKCKCSPATTRHTSYNVTCNTPSDEYWRLVLKCLHHKRIKIDQAMLFRVTAAKCEACTQWRTSLAMHYIFATNRDFIAVKQFQKQVGN